MNLFDQQDSERNSYETYCDVEDNKNFANIITLVSLLNKKFYSPVSFVTEYVENFKLQHLVTTTTGYSKFGFIVLFMRNFPTVAKSRKLKRIIDEKNERDAKDAKDA